MPTRKLLQERLSLSPTSPKPHPTHPKPPAPSSWWTQAVGREIHLHLRDGSTIRGVLLRGWRYELLLRTAEGERIVFKHAIDWGAQT